MSTGKIGQWVWSGFYPERNNQTSNNSKTVGIEKDEVRQNSQNTEVPTLSSAALVCTEMIMEVRFNTVLAASPLVLNAIVSEGVDVIISASPNIMKALVKLELRIGLEL